MDRGKVHREVLYEGGIYFVEGKADRHVVELLDLGDVLVHAHVDEIGELAGVRLAERMLLVEHALESKEDVVGIELAAGLEVISGMKLDPGTQMERIGEAVIADLPFGCQRG